MGDIGIGQGARRTAGYDSPTIDPPPRETAMTKPDPRLSEGARLERWALRAKLRREIRSTGRANAVVRVRDLLQWVLDRQKRYDRRPGGLGR